MMTDQKAAGQANPLRALKLHPRFSHFPYGFGEFEPSQ